MAEDQNFDEENQGFEEVEENEEVEEVKEEPVQSSAGGYQYRYVCPSCTGVAYYSEDILEEHPQGNCKNCGMPLGAVEVGSFIALTEDQKQALIEQGV